MEQANAQRASEREKEREREREREREGRERVRAKATAEMHHCLSSKITQDVIAGSIATKNGKE